jgi:acyl-CoA hydrolase
MSAQRGKVGNTSVQYAISVFAADIETGAEEMVFSTNITFVRVDAEGRKTSLPAI